MIKRQFTFLCVLMCCFQFIKAQLPRPTSGQLRWHDMEFYLFTHFGPNTFTNKEWGEGTEKEAVFNPAQLDCRQWCRIAKAAGATGIIITAKHHDGFCLWPSKFSTHTVRESKWRNGKGDVLKELSAACKAYGLKFGVYLSPWDRNHPAYGTPQYNDVFVNMMTEIFTSYGPICELWWDGANGEGPDGKKQTYDWKRFKATVKKLSPNTVIFSDIGPQIRWVGNEYGIAGKTNWNTLDTIGFSAGKGAPPTDTLNSGNANGQCWIPAECDVSIRPGWFYHQEDDDKVKTPEQLFALYLKSVGRGSTLLLNVPPDRRGIVNDADIAALEGFKKLRTESFATNLSVTAVASTGTGNLKKNIPAINDNNAGTFINIPAGSTAATGTVYPPLNPLGEKAADKQTVRLHFQNPVKINCIVLREFIKDGQSVVKFELTAGSGEKSETITGTTIGHKRILTFPAVTTSDLYLHILESKTVAKISEVATYLIDEGLVEKE